MVGGELTIYNRWAPNFGQFSCLYLSKHWDYRWRSPFPALKPATHKIPSASQPEAWLRAPRTYRLTLELFPPRKSPALVAGSILLWEFKETVEDSAGSEGSPEGGKRPHYSQQQVRELGYFMWRGQENKGESHVEGVASLVLFHSATQIGSESRLSPTSPVPLWCPYIYVWGKQWSQVCGEGQVLGTRRIT